MPSLGISAWYRAPMGGLQENIRATAMHARAEGFEVRLALPHGAFRDSLIAQGFDVLGVDFDDRESFAAAEAHLRSCDVLHAHPGPSRALLVDIAARTRAPLFFTVHGAWADSIQRYIADLRHVFCVSDSIRRRVLASIPKYAERVSVAPNGVDLAHFPCVQASASRTIVIASRFDADKRIVVDFVRHLWEEQARREAFDVRWIVAGQGTLMGELEEAAASLRAFAGTDLVTFDGWIAAPDLAKRYRDASAVIAAGRGAMEAMAMGRPGVAVGSGGACPLFDMPGLIVATECNFGGIGSTPLAEIDIPALWGNLHRAAAGDFTEFGIAGSAYVREHLDASAINARMLERYREALAIEQESHLP